MVAVCVVRGCKSTWTPGSGITFHRFPTSEIRTKQWLEKLPLKGKFYKSGVVCSLHFTKDDYRNGHLTPNACPQMYDEPVFSNNENVPITSDKMGYIVIHPMKMKPTNEKEVRACIACLETAGKLYDLQEECMEQVFGDLTGLNVCVGSLCYICLQLLRKFAAFRARCLTTHEILEEIPLLTTEVLNSIDRNYLKHNYSIEPTAKMWCDPNIPNTDHNPLPDIEPKPVKRKKTNKADKRFAETYVKDEVKIEKEYIKIEIDDDGGVLEEDVLKDDDDDKNDSDFATEMEIENLENNSSDFDEQDHSDDDDEDDDYKKVPAKRKAKQIEVKPKIKEYKKKDEEHAVLMRVNKLFSDITRMYNRSNQNQLDMFEDIHKECVLFKNGEIKRKKLSAKESMLRNFIKDFLDLNQQLSDLYKIDLEFVSLYDKQKEMEDRRASGEYKGGCNLCCKKFNQPDAYKRHLSRAHSSKSPFECVICKYRVKTYTQLMSHLLRHARRIQCRQCKLVIFHTSPSWYKIKEHTAVHRGVLPTCEFCGKSFHEQKSLYSHKKFMHFSLIESSLCVLCGGAFISEAGLAQHMALIHQQAVQCDSCGTWFQHKPTLAAHLHKEGGCRPGLQSSCPMCGFNFATSELMTAHYDRLHKKIPCTNCKKTFKGVDSFESHQSQMRCNKRSTRGAKMEKSNNKDKVKPGRTADDKQGKVQTFLICEFCGKSNFRCPANLKIHLRLHNGERPFKCEYCSRRFRLRQTMLLHVATHTGERRYRCEVCARAFVQRGQLKNHLTTHTHERPYPCEVCGRRFAQKHNMVTHRRAVHEGWPARQRQRRAKERPA